MHAGMYTCSCRTSTRLSAPDESEVTHVFGICLAGMRWLSKTDLLPLAPSPADGAAEPQEDQRPDSAAAVAGGNLSPAQVHRLVTSTPERIPARTFAALVKDKLNEFVEAVSLTREQVTITKNGSPAAVLVGADECESLQETLF